MKKLKFFLSLLMLFTFSLGTMWGEVVSGTTYSTNTSSFPSGWTKDVNSASNTSQLVLYSGNYIQTDDFCQNGITSVVVKARKYGGPSETERIITVEWVPTSGDAIVLGTLDPTTTTLTNKTLSTLTNTPTANTNGSIKISCKGAASAKGDAISEITITYTAGTCGGGTPTCATPTFTPAAGSYEGTQNVTISSTDGATIYYTTDGSTPTTSSSVYSSAIPVSADMTIKAYAVKTDYNDSEVATAAYTITEGPDVTITFEGNTDWDIPSGSGNKTVDEGTYTDGTYTIKIAGSTGEGYYINGYLILGKTGAYVELPEFSSPIEKIVVVGTSGGSTGVKFNIYDGTTAVSTEVTGCKNVEQEFEIENPAANKVYTITVTSSANLQISKIKIYFGSASAVAKPVISGQTPFVNSTTVTITQADADHIYYTTDGSTPTTSSTEYTAPFTIDATKTVKAIAVKGSDVSEVAEKTFTKATVLSIDDAFTTVDGGGDLTNKFVEGYIYRVESYNSTYHSLTYWLTADGHKGDSLEVYSGKGLSSADFSSLEDLSVGDKVVVCGTLKKYNDIYEFDKNNYLVSRVEKGDVATVTVSGTATTTSYDPGTKLSMDGLTATATYANGFQADVTDAATWAAAPQFMGTSVTSFNATATYGGIVSAAYPVAVTLLKYHVTFANPEHGTLVVKRYSSVIASGDEFPKNTDLTVEATPDDGYQLATLTAGGVDILSSKAFTVGTEDIAVVATFEEIPHVYSVVGVESVISDGWDPEATATEMTLNEGVYSYKVENVVLAAGTNYEYKIVEDHAWTVSYPQSGNASFSVDKNGRYDVTFTLNKSTKAYAATPELLEEIAVNRTFAVLGTFNSWSATAEEGASDVATLSFTVNFDATGDYAFKVKVNDAWLGNGATYNRDNTGATITENGDDMTLHVDQDGEYTFTWTFASNALSITYPALKANPELSWNGVDGSNHAWAYRVGKPFDFPTLVKPDGVSVTYSSDDGGTIITINETTGAITLLSEGVAHITATSAANDTYNAGTATYTLYVCGPTSIALGGAAEKLTYEYGDPFDRTGLTATLSFNNGGGTYDVTDVATWTYDKETITSGGSVHVTVSYVGQTDEKYVYNVKVATHAVTWTQPAVGGTFEVLDNTSNPFSSGTKFRKGIEITVVPTAASNYELATLTANGDDIKSTKKFTIGTEDVVIAATFVKVPVAAGLEWNTSNAYVRKGSATNEPPYLVNPNGVEVTYESTDESIATINASTGAIHLLANGETTLKAIFAGNEDYLAQTVECTLHVAAGIVTITPAAPVALELGNVPFGSTRADYGQSFHLNITNLISGQYNQVKIDFTGSAFWTAGNNYITDNDQDGVIDVDVTIVPSEYWWSLSEANALGEQNTTITLMCTGSAQFEDVVVGTATMNVVASIPTGIDNAEAQEKAVKTIENGMIVVIKNGVRYTILGEKVK